MNKTTKQYTIRNIPPQLDYSLRQLAKQTHKSLNQVLLEALIASTIPKTRDFRGIIGSLTNEEAIAQEAEIKRQRQIDKNL